MKPAFFSACLSIPPSVNHLYGQNGARRYKLPSVVAYQQLAEIQLLTAWHDTARIDAVRSAHTPLSVSIQVRLSRRAYQQRDLDNMAKIILDTVLVSYLGIDDSQVTDLFLSKRLMEHGAVATLLVQICESDMEDFRNDGNTTNTTNHCIPGARPDNCRSQSKTQETKRRELQKLPALSEKSNQRPASVHKASKKRGIA